MGKDIGRIYKYSQSQISKTSIKAPIILYLASQISSSIELTKTCVPSVIDKNKPILFCVPKIPSIIIQASQIMTTYSLVKQK